MKFACPLIVVENVQRSRDFYEKVLQQKVKYDFGENVLFEGDFTIHLRSHYGKVARIPDSRIIMGSNSFELYFETDRLEEIHQELLSMKVEFLHEIDEQPWGQRVLRFYDPDRHIVEIGETLEALVIRLFKQGYACEEIMKKTGMPRKFVEAAVKNAMQVDHTDSII